MKSMWRKFTALLVATVMTFFASGISAWGQITNNPAGDIADAVEDGVSIFNSVYSIVIAAVVLGFLLWVLSAARRRR